MKKVIVHAKFNSLMEITEEQTSLSFKEVDDPKNESILFYKLNGKSLDLELSGINLDVYLCRFTERQNYEQAFFKGESIPYVDVVREFKAYVCNKNNVIFFNTNTKIGNTFIKKYNSYITKQGYTEIAPFEVDFSKIEQKSREITGSWFDTEGSMVTSQGLMGYAIEKSVQFTQLKKTSEISSLTVVIYVEQLNSDLNVIISKKGSLYIQNKIPNNFNTVDILWIVFHDLILN